MEKLIYISGSGRSGSTLLDIILGSHPEAFSIGELNQLFKNGLIEKEFCSCQEIVQNCGIWTEIISRWEASSELGPKNYYKVEKYYESKKNLRQLLKQLKKPSKEFIKYKNDTKRLFKIISEVTGAKVLIESSKSTNRALILNTIFENDSINIIHLIRKFSGVLNSNKKVFEANIKQGIEKSTKKRGLKFLFYIIPVWVFENMIVYFYLGKKRTIIRYEEFVKKTESILEKVYKSNLNFKNEFRPEHLVAGNRLRMKPMVSVNEKLASESLSNLNFLEKLIAKFIDVTFYKLFT